MWALITFGIEFIAFLYFVCSFFPGGLTGAKYFMKFVAAAAKAGCKVMMKCMD